MIKLTSEIDIKNKYTINGTTQPGIQIDGDAAAINGLVLASGSDGSTIEGLDIVDFGGTGISVQSNNDTIMDNLIGTDPTGTAKGPGNSTGISITGSNNTVGGTTAASANIIGFNTISGVSITGPAATNNHVIGNYIGINPANPRINLGNGVGVGIDNASSNFIGGGTNQYTSSGGLVSATPSGSANLIGFNSSAGVSITGLGSTGNAVEANFIGVDPTSPNSTGAFNVGNGTGILIDGSAYNNTIGAVSTTTVTGPSGNSTVTGTVGGNVIGFNTQSGISIGSSVSATAADANLVYGNYVGTDFYGDKLGNSVGAIIANDSSFNILGPGTLTATVSGVSGALMIGQLGSGLGNIISSNSGDGVLIGDGLANDGANENLLQGNTIGATTTLPGGSFSGNGGSGIEILNSFQNSIGGTVGATISPKTGAIAKLGDYANLILGNAGDGVSISIGGSATVGGDVISGNWIAGNNNGVHASGDLSGSVTTLPLPLIADNFIGTSQDGTSVYDLQGNRLGNSKSGILLEESKL